LAEGFQQDVIMLLIFIQFKECSAVFSSVSGVLDVPEVVQHTLQGAFAHVKLVFGVSVQVWIELQGV